MASLGASLTQSRILKVATVSSSSAELSFGDDKILDQISATHAPSASNLDTKSLLNITTNILNRASHVVHGAVTGTQAHLDKVEDKPYQADVDVPSPLIENLSCEMMCGCKASGHVQLHETTLSMFGKLSGYSWDAKAVLALSAYAINYGDFWLLDQIYQENDLAKPMAILKRMPVLTKPNGLLKNRIVAINTLTKTILEVTECIVEIEKLSVKNNPKDVPTLSKAMAELPMAVYLTIKTVIACASQINSLTTTTDESQPLLLSTLAPKLNMILGKLKDFLTVCKISIEENKRYQRILKLLVTYTDNVEVLQSIIYTKDDMLIDLSTKRTVKIDYLRKKHVLLFISGLDISMEELDILKKTYADSKVLQSKGSFHLSLPIIKSSHHEEHLFEMVWIPVVEQWTEEAEKKFEKLKAEMPWYTVHNFSVTDGAVVKFLKQVWHFQGKPIVTVLNPQGKVESENAMHIIKVWGSKAFPFTETRRKELWKEQSGFKVDLIFEGVHPEVTKWIKQDKFVLFYGGTDVEWVKKLEEKVRAFSKEMGVTIELVNFHGKTTKDSGLMERFWNRVESLLFSKMADDHDEVDEVSHEIQKLFGYKKVGKWAMLSKGPKVVISGEGNTVLDVFSHNTSNIKERGDATNFDVIFIDWFNKITALDPGCCHYRFPSTAGKVPESLKCPKCPRVMERYVTFQCCHKDEGAMTNGH